MALITCYDEWGNAVAVPAGDVSREPAVYTILLENGQALLQRHPASGLWQPPGGPLRGPESPRLAARRRFYEQTGLMFQVGPLLHIEERSVFENGAALQRLLLFFAVERPAGVFAGYVDASRPGAPEWVDVSSLTRNMLHLGYEAIQAARLRPGQ
jgi:8-oxo-dGTP pyrophosphatase MutT (NUDIX family)